jgi:hypothetical protein
VAVQQSLDFKEKTLCLKMVQSCPAGADFSPPDVGKGVEKLWERRQGLRKVLCAQK